MQKGISILAMVLVLASMTLFVTPAEANNYGAIAYSQSTGASGRSWDYRSRAAAERAALNNCYRHAGDCRVIWFRNACGAVAVGNGGGWGSAWGNTRRQAQNAAIRSCRRYTSGCRVRVWQCTSR
ncbi:MAG: DUF4189 domain-containing protein [Hyphomicrobiales bacterium]|nr:DUF4189 domain-containing protein [Hyphomicrobiales bacterium]